MIHLLTLLLFLSSIMSMEQEQKDNHNFLNEIPTFQKFEITQNEPLKNLNDFKPYKITNNYKFFFSEDDNFIIIQEKDNQLTIKFKKDQNLIEIVSCSFSGISSPSLLNKALITMFENKETPFGSKLIAIKLSLFDLHAVEFFSKSNFLCPIEYSINERIKIKEPVESEKINKNDKLFYLYFNPIDFKADKLILLNQNKNVGFKKINFEEENIDTSFLKDLLSAKKFFYDNKEFFLFLDQEKKQQSKGNQIIYQGLWENFINNYYLDTRTAEKYILKKDNHKLIKKTKLENNYFSEFYEKTFSNPSTKGIVNNGTFFIKEETEKKDVKGYANVRFFPENSTLFLNLVFLDKAIQKKGIFKDFYKKTKEIVLKKYNPKTIYFYTTEQNAHLEFWKKENFAIKETETPGKLKLICTVSDSLSKE